jgi:hypothetical protein
VAKCPTCGQSVPDKDDSLPWAFLIGDRVKHMSGSIGEVVAIEDYRGTECAIVEFYSDTKPWRGAYDATWFRQNPGGLTKIE